ncbi:MAG TPA: ubiquinol-cytochrome c reductase iron-sulfur subunit [Terricaulis sp.]|nr:ubiquinol-cytochrome c reductase iron-sulfur subunit [Terricaulis sp.]HRP11290.1 ubiquinol-cytochrome c reductase iron-sulfur subunit [Terricaulis sp.]
MADATTEAHGDETSRRDFIFIAAGGMAAVGAAATVWPFIDQMNPAADTRALASTEVDLSAVELGQQVRILWQGKPVFVRHRTAEEIAAAQRDDFASLKDPQHDAARLVQSNGEAGKAEFIILQASCTHLGCVPTFVEGSSYGGWFCPCHGSDYDTSGRIRRGPAPLNLLIAPYVYTNETTIRIG